jgi:hypothetical protein
MSANIKIPLISKNQQPEQGIGPVCFSSNKKSLRISGGSLVIVFLQATL